METINQQLAHALERIKELEADNEAVKHAALCHCDENDKLNKDLEDAENTYYAIKGELDNAKARIKEFEEQLAHSNMYALINQLHKIIWKNEERIKELRYNLAMAKAYGWKYTYTNCDTYGFWLRNKKKDYKTYRQQWLRIAEALKARANKLKEDK